MTNRPVVIVLLAAVTACSKPATTSVENDRLKQLGLLGKWCFKPSAVQATWEFIEISKNGGYSAVDRHGDGSTSTQLLTSKPGGLWVEGSDTGDHYVLPSASSGDLVIADNEGEIGRGTAMPQSSSATDCFSS